MEEAYQEHKIALLSWQKEDLLSYKDFTDRELAESFKEYTDTLLSFGIYVTLPLFVEEYFETFIKESFEKRFGSDAQKWFDVAVNPIKDSTVLEEEKALLEIALSGDIGVLPQHRQKFAWMANVGFFEEYYDLEYYQQRLESFQKEGAEVRLTKIIKERKEQARLFDELCTYIADDTYLLEIVKTANEAVFFRSYRTEMFYSSAWYNQDFLWEVGRRLKLSNYKDLVWFFWDEIYQALMKSEGLDKNLIAERQDGYVFLSDFDGKYECWVGDTGTKIYGAYAQMAHQSNLETGLVGKGAFPGCVQGEVVVVHDVTELAKVERGQILVTHATNVNFVPVLDRVSAIVTEEGGILSHAAIISREMRIPCVIGTKIATQVLRDGDYIEVDADNGVVRILEKKEKMVFEKTIERDSTLIMQGFFAQAMIEDNQQDFGVSNPYAPVIIHAVSADNIQIWENEKALCWFSDKLLAKNQKDESFLKNIAHDQQAVLEAIRPYWEKGYLTESEEIEEYLRLVRRGVRNISLVYYTGMDERSPEIAQAIAAKVREDDEFFSRNDIFITECVQARGHDESLAVVVLIGELVDLPERKVLEQRRRGCVLVDGKMLFLGTLDVFGQEHAAEMNFLVPETEQETTTEIRGQVAQKGKVTGRVKIVKNRRQLDKVEEGDILVSPMTTPDFLPAMKKAIAFVTDEGGIVCHAAIVAREMKKPCIIATKIATQVLKDGDLVEVDADNGVVRILEKAEVFGVKDKVLEYKWEKWIERPYYAFFQSCFEPATIKETYEKFGFDGISVRAQLFQNGHWYFCEEVMEETRVQIAQYFQEHSIFDVTQALDTYYQEAEKKIEDIKVSILSSKEKFERFYEILSPVTAFVWLAHGIEVHYKKRIADEVPKYIEGDYEKFIADASFPKRKNEHALMEDMMRTSATDQEIVDEFGWIKVRDCVSEPFSSKEIHEMRKNLTDGIHDTAMQVPEDLQSLVSELQELIYYRTARTDVFYKLCFLGRSIMKERGDDLGIPLTEMQYYRAKSFGTDTPEKYNKEHSFVSYENQVLFQNEPLLEEVVVQNVDSFQGTVAYAGKMQGKVIIIKTVAEINKVQLGDILVTQMTFPSFIPAMQKAAAFVTDEGGITCHAAIVAREMKKPCIIGTKIATQVLKDGDFVEVDADNGVVRILNRATVDINDYNHSDWVSVSKGNWSFLSCSDFINHYSREVLIGGQNPFDHPIQVCRQGKSELWFRQSEIDLFGLNQSGPNSSLNLSRPKLASWIAQKTILLT